MRNRAAAVFVVLVLVGALAATEVVLASTPPESTVPGDTQPVRPAPQPDLSSPHAEGRVIVGYRGGTTRAQRSSSLSSDVAAAATTLSSDGGAVTKLVQLQDGVSNAAISSCRRWTSSRQSRTATPSPARRPVARIRH